MVYNCLYFVPERIHTLLRLLTFTYNFKFSLLSIFDAVMYEDTTLTENLVYSYGSGHSVKFQRLIILMRGYGCGRAFRQMNQSVKDKSAQIAQFEDSKIKSYYKKSKIRSFLGPRFTDCRKILCHETHTRQCCDLNPNWSS